MPASTTLAPIADALVTVIQSLSDPTVGAVKWSRLDTDTRPAAVVGMPITIRRTEPDQKEGQVGTDDWNVDFPVDFYFEFDELEAAQTQAVQVIEAWIKAIDADQTLGDLPGLLEAKVVEAGPPEKLTAESTGRATLFWPTRVSLIRFV